MFPWQQNITVFQITISHRRRQCYQEAETQKWRKIYLYVYIRRYLTDINRAQILHAVGYISANPQINKEMRVVTAQMITNKWTFTYKLFVSNRLPVFQ